MKLITRPIREALLRNGAISAAGKDTADIKPVLKLFTPWAGATWLISECDPDEETRLFGLRDLGLGFPELGYVDLRELQALCGPAGLRVERDRHFTATMSLRQYADAADAAGGIRA